MELVCLLIVQKLINLSSSPATTVPTVSTVDNTSDRWDTKLLALWTLFWRDVPFGEKDSFLANCHLGGLRCAELCSSNYEVTVMSQ